MTVTGRLENGVVTNHVVNWLSPMKERVTIVTGERGAFVADTGTADLTFYANGVIPTEWEAVSAFRGVSEETSRGTPSPSASRSASSTRRSATRCWDCATTS